MALVSYWFSSSPSAISFSDRTWVGSLLQIPKTGCFIPSFRQTCLGENMHGSSITHCTQLGVVVCYGAHSSIKAPQGRLVFLTPCYMGDPDCQRCTCRFGLRKPRLFRLPQHAGLLVEVRLHRFPGARGNRHRSSSRRGSAKEFREGQTGFMRGQISPF